jgi:hypothetical protein
MKSVSINFSVRRRRRPSDVAGWVLLVVATGVSLVLSWHYVVLVRKFDAGEIEHARMQRPASGTGHVPGVEEKTRLRTEMRFAKRVIEQLDTPWTALFVAIETAYDDNVMLLSIEPEPERREVRLFAEAKDTNAMLTYIRQVRQSPVLKDAWLVNHQVNLQDPLHPVRFTISARWLSPSAESSSPTAVTGNAPNEVMTNTAPEGKTTP